MNAYPNSLSPSPSLLPLLLAVLTGLLLLPAAHAQGPEDGPPNDAPLPLPPIDLMQMAIDTTPPPLDPRAQQPSQAQPTPSNVTPAPSAAPGRNQRRLPQRNPAAPNVGTPPATPGSSNNNNAASLPSPTPAAPGATIRLNFQNASLADVLNYLSAAAGFIITQETPVTGTVNVVSQQPVSIDEAVDLLSSILTDKGYAVVRNGRILKIVALQDAPKNGNVQVFVGQEPKDIPRKDNIVTQIIPVRYAEVGKLVDNLRPLLSNNATISSNDSSNAIILTDTQTNIHRMAEIIHALDTSISGISTIKVFTLRFSDAKGLADVITQLFAPSQNANKNNNQFGNLPPQFQRFFQQGGGGGNNNSSPQSEARQAAARVVAVADETSNSVIIAAPDEVMSEVAEVIGELDTSTSDITETQIFRLLHADATELAAVLTSLYADTGTTQTGSNNNNRGGNQQNRGGNQQGQGATAGRSERSLLQSRVVAVADARTNSILISASHDTMAQIGVTIGRLDADKSKKQHVTVYTLSHADPDNVATILRGMYSSANNSSSSTATQPSTSALATRSQNGASSDITNSLNTSGSRSGTSGR